MGRDVYSKHEIITLVFSVQTQCRLKAHSLEGDKHYYVRKVSQYKHKAA